MAPPPVKQRMSQSPCGIGLILYIDSTLGGQCYDYHHKRGYFSFGELSSILLIDNYLLNAL